MNLVIDVGNSLVKFGVFQNEKLLDKFSASLERFKDFILNLENEYPQIKNAIIASVAKLSHDQLNFIGKKYQLLVLNQGTKLPFQNLYQTPKTLGVDRIGLVSASVYHYFNNNVLIIDAGSCITFDFVTANNEYLGGAISPGIKMRYRALNTFTANLPFLEMQLPKSLIGQSTNASIHSGIVNGVVNEIDGTIAEYKSKYADLTVILTGGDCKFLSKQLKSSIFANSNFLLEGLNYILQINSD